VRRSSRNEEEEQLKERSDQDITAEEKGPLTKESSKSNDHQKNEFIDRRYGGSYLEFCDLIRRELEYLLLLGFEIKIYFDGKPPVFKSVVTDSRKQQRVDYWEMLHKVIFNEYNVGVINQTQLPWPQFTTKVFQFVLGKYFCSGQQKIDVIYCEKEVDPVLATECCRLNAGVGKRAYVYSDDTDFFVMKDCPTMKFAAFSLEHMKKLLDSSYVMLARNNTGFHVEVWRRSKLSLLLGLANEKQFVEFCIFLGNDFTRWGENFRSEFQVTAQGSTSNVVVPPKFSSSAHIEATCYILDFV
jgi:hypothetical protein